MQHLKRRPVSSLSSLVFLLLAAVQGLAQQLPKGVTPEDLATNNKLFIELAKKAFRWEEPTDPVRIAGPMYFVGTKGLGRLSDYDIGGPHSDEHGHALVGTDDRRVHPQTRIQTRRDQADDQRARPYRSRRRVCFFKSQFGTRWRS